MRSIVNLLLTAICAPLLLAPTARASSYYKTLLQKLKVQRQQKIREDPRSNYLRQRNLPPLQHDEELEEEERMLIWQGESVDAHEPYPWFVELLARSSTGGEATERRCAGTMLSGDTVVTLANCLYTTDGVIADPTESIAIVKRQEVEIGKGIRRNWKIIREHPDHIFPEIDNNIAVITISGDELFPQEDIGLLNNDVNAPAINSSVTALGFGETKVGSGFATTLQKEDFQILTGNFPCDITNNSTFMCADTVGVLDSDRSADSSWSESDEGDEDFCFGDEGAPFVRNDRTLYGLYIEGGTCNGKGATAAIVLRISAFRTWILDTACEISATRCIRSCSLLSGLSLGVGNLATRVVDTAGAVWGWVSSPFRAEDDQHGEDHEQDSVHQ